MDMNWTVALQDIQKAIDDEATRIKIASKFLPFPQDVITSDAINISSDIVTQNGNSLTVAEGDTTSFYQISVNFKLTQSQYTSTGGKNTAITLATRAANLLAQAEDILIFQGDYGKNNPIFTQGKVIIDRPGSPSPGLLKLKDLDPDRIIKVSPTEDPLPNNPTLNRYGENSYAAVAQGYSLLQSKGHYGPYALVLNDRIYADTHAPLKTTLIMPADRVKGLVRVPNNPMIPMISEMFYGTGTMPILEKNIPTGLLVSLGGNTMDLVIKTRPTITQLPQTGVFFPFQVTQQFALRLKDPTAVIRFEFQPNEIKAK